MDNGDDQIPEAAIITRDGLMCKCGHRPEEHSAVQNNLGCLSCACPMMVDQLTPRPHGSLASKIMPDGRLATLYEEVFGFRLLIGPADCMVGGNEYVQYNLSTKEDMLYLFLMWDGYGYPEGWTRKKVGNNDFEYAP